MAKGTGWKTLITADDRMTGPSKAILAEAKKLKDKGIVYELVDFTPRKVDEVKDEANDQSDSE